MIAWRLATLLALAVVIAGCEPWHFAYRNDTGRPISVTTVRADGTVGAFLLPVNGSIISATRARDLIRVDYEYDGVRCSVEHPSAVPDVRWNEMKQLELRACEGQHD